MNLNKNKLNFVNFKGEDILTQEQFSKIDGKNRLFWILDKKINNGKYCLESENGKIILKKLCQLILISLQLVTQH